MVHHVYLVPGFFGFANLGELLYFSHVRGQIEAAFARRDQAVAIHDVPTLPTASLRRRAARLLEVIEESAGDDDGPIHLIGHSTGGLDARLLVTPDVSLPGAPGREAFTARVRSVVAVATPHRGTPLAAFFMSVLGQRLLKLLSLSTLHGIRLGSVPLPAVLALAGALAGVGTTALRGGRSLAGDGLRWLPLVGRLRFGRREGPDVDARGRAAGWLEGGLLDQVYRQILADFHPERQHEISAFFEQIGQEQALLPQLSPEGMDLFDATVVDRPGVRYGCVITCAAAPSLSATMSVGLSPSGQAMHALYRALHQLTGAMSRHMLAEPSPVQLRALREAFGEVPGRADNDAIVPALSQLWGEIIYACRADHLDVIGHFADASHDPPHVDWLTTQSGFRRAQFDALWSAVSEFVLAAG